MKSIAITFFFVSNLAFGLENEAPEKKDVENKVPIVESKHHNDSHFPAGSYQMETIFKSGMVNFVGGAAGPLLEYTKIKGKDALFYGGYGYAIVNHNIMIGGLAAELNSNIPLSDFNSYPRSLNFEYAGILLGYIIESERKIHLTFSTVIGPGEIGWEYNTGQEGSSLEKENSRKKQYFLIIKPSHVAEFNVNKWFRISAGISENICVGNITLADLKRSDLLMPSAQLMFTFGKF